MEAVRKPKSKSKAKRRETRPATPQLAADAATELTPALRALSLSPSDACDVTIAIGGDVAHARAERAARPEADHVAGSQEMASDCDQTCAESSPGAQVSAAVLERDMESGATHTALAREIGAESGATHTAPAREIDAESGATHTTPTRELAAGGYKTYTALARELRGEGFHAASASVPCTGDAAVSDGPTATLQSAADSRQLLTTVPSVRVACLAEEPASPSAPPAPLFSAPVSISEGPYFFETEAPPALHCLVHEVAPLTDAQLADLCPSVQLSQRDVGAQLFVREYGPARPADEFHRLVAGYRRAGATLQAAAARYRRLHAQYQRRRGRCWDLVRHVVRAEADCDDGRTLSGSHEFRCAVLDQVALDDLRLSLSALRRLLHNYSLHSHSLQQARLLVETYLARLTSDFPELSGPAVTAASLHYATPRHQQCAAALRSCCAVLFAQQRQAALEASQAAQLRAWLRQLVALLLRVATADDHLFLLHQALRCPSGSASWSAALLQLPPPQLPAGLDLTLTALALILTPVSERVQFVAQSEPAAVSWSEEAQRDGWDRLSSAGEDSADGLSASEADADADDGASSPDGGWVVLDDEELEAEKTSGFTKLQEQDLITFFNQLPWADLVRHLLKMGRSADDCDLYESRLSSCDDILRLLACASCVIGLLAGGLAEYSGTTHRQLNKRLCHQLLHMVQYVTDHWDSYSVTSADDMATKGRLLVEYDSFVCRSAVTVLATPHLSVWQFLASFPFGRLTTRTAWKLLWLFHTSGRPQEAAALPDVPPDQDHVWAAEVLAPTFHAMFEHQLVHMGQSEVYFRLTALANMVMARPARERTFIKTVTRDLVQVSFVTPTTRELCSRCGRDLLAAICSRHPFVMSYILSLTQEHLHTLGKTALYLLSGLPLDLWRPSASDMAQVCAWLADNALDSVESQLAQLALSRLDWGVRPYTGQLALPADFHRRAALAVVTAQAARAPELSRSGGVVSHGRRQVGALASLVSESIEQRFQTWAWRQVARLRLHALDQPDGTAAWVLSKPEEALAVLPSPGHAEVAALEEAARHQQPLAVYALLLMTTLGHSVAELSGGGLCRLGQLVPIGRPDAVGHLMEVVMPLLVHHFDDFCDDVFPTLLQTLLSADLSYLRLMKTLVVAGQPGPLVQQLAGVVEGHVTNHRCYGQETPVPLVTLWLRFFTCISDWSRDASLLYLLNHLLRAAFVHAEARRQAGLIIDGLVQDGSGIRPPAGLASLLAWVSGGSLQPLLPAGSLPDAPWLAWFCLCAETRQQTKCGLWHDLICTLCEDRHLSLDQALKRVCSQQRLPAVAVQDLAVYRWAQQALDTDLDCPLLPAFWQHFFALFLARAHDMHGHDLGSVGDRFMEGMVNTQYLRRLVRRLRETAEHYRQRVELAQSRPADAIDAELMLLRAVSQMVGTFSLWLEEPRLLGPDVYLPDLPASYQGGRLVQLLCQPPPGDVWPEFVNDAAVARLSDECLRQRTASHHDHRPSSAASTPVKSDDSPAQRIIKRLRSYDARAELPAAAAFASAVPPLPSAADASVGPAAALSALEPAFSQLAAHAIQFCGERAEHSALDGQYLELLPGLYTNETTQVVQRVPCEAPCRAGVEGRCSGPAAVLLECETARLNGGVYHGIDENRRRAAQLEAVARADPSPPLAAAAVHLETFIQWLVLSYRREASGGGGGVARLQQTGSRLFHHVVAVSSEESRQCPAVDRLLAACLAVLGATFVEQQAAECAPLLEAVLRHEHLADRLVVHLCPAAATADDYVRLYQAVSCVSRDKAALATTILSKFDVDQWLLTRRPAPSPRAELVTVLTAALSSLGAEARHAHWAALHEVYRRHLTTVHGHQFPDHYSQTLALLLDASRDGRLSPVCWYDFVNVLTEGAATFSVDMDAERRQLTVAALADHPSRLLPQQAADTLRLLADRFLDERLRAGLYGLYPRYKLYTAPLSVLLGVVASAVITGAVQREPFSEELLERIWLSVRDAFAPWVSPLALSEPRVWRQCATWLQRMAGDKQHLTAWVTGDESHAQVMVDMFLHCVMLLHNTLTAGRSALSHLWHHYCATYAAPAVHEHTRALVHARMLRLPWDQLQPQLHDVERMVQLLDVYLPEAHSFTAQVVVQLPWRQVVDSYESQTPTASARLHACMLSVFVKVAFEPKIRQSGALFLLLSRAEAFSWHLVDAATYQRVLSWYVMSCDPVSALESEAREPVDVALMGFLQVVAGHVAEAQRLHPETPQKRAAYLSAVVRLLVNAASTQKALVQSQPDGFTRTLLRLLRETEVLVGKLPAHQALAGAVPLVCELLQCTSARSPTGLQKLCSDRLTRWVTEESSCVLLCPMLRTSGTIVGEMQHLCNFWEALITALFSKGSTVQWPELCGLAEFPAQSLSRLLSASLQSGCLFVLHLHLLQRLNADAEPQQLAAVCVSWLTELTALSGLSEVKLCLLLYQCVGLLEQLADAGYVAEVCRHVRALSAALLIWGEDRDGTGLLGAIGLGRRSPLSLQFRLLCRVLAATMLAQLCSDGSLRLEPRPEEVTERLSSDSSSSGSESKWGLPRDLVAEAYPALERLTALRSRRDCTPHLQAIEEAVADVLSATTTFRSCRHVLADAVRRTYCDPCLHQIVASPHRLV